MAVGAFMAVGALGALTSKFVVVVGLSKLQPCHYVAMFLVGKRTLLVRLGHAQSA